MAIDNEESRLTSGLLVSLVVNIAKRRNGHRGIRPPILGHCKAEWQGMVGVRL